MIDIEKLKSSIEGKGFISSVIYLDEVDSTNSFAGKEDVPLDSVVIAGHQTGGKGRMGRSWVSEKHLNLTFSIKKKLTIFPANNQFAVFYFSYHLFSAIKKVLTNYLDEEQIAKLHIKWPNDILFDGKKLSGILIESVLPKGIYTIGIGLNCNQNTFPDELNAVSLKQIIGNEFDLSGLLISIINEFSESFDDLNRGKYDNIYDKWKNSTKIIGKECEFSTVTDYLNTGKIIDLNMDGSISIESNGKITNYHSGDIRITGFN
jgi:BirA family biotin operon repressor/biotin-[acetyl-CoA-carboxylase] ligase